MTVINPTAHFVAVKIREAHERNPFCTHPAYVLPSEQDIDEALRVAHFGEPRTPYMRAALDWVIDLLEGSPYAPPVWLAPLLDLPDEADTAPPDGTEPPAPGARFIGEIAVALPAPEPKKRARKAEATPAAKAAAEELAAVRSALQAAQAEADTLRRERDQARDWRQRAESEREDLRQMLQAAETERDELRRKLDAARIEAADLGVELEKANARRFAEIFWQAHRTNADGVELVRVQVRREETLLASVCPAEGGGWWWATADGDEGKAKSEERARSLAAFAAGEEVDDE